VLEAVDRARLILKWFEGEIPSWDEFKEDRRQATNDLLRIGLIERIEDYPQQHSHPFRLTAEGGAFLENVRARVGVNGNINWYRLNEIELPSHGE
jgi:hypothetical protein